MIEPIRKIVEANDALLATLCQYDALWDGVLPPEIIDAEFYDCPNLRGHVDMPYRLDFKRLPLIDIVQQRDRREALEAVKGAVVARVDSIVGAWVKTGFEASLLSWCLEYDSIYDAPLAEPDPHERSQIMLDSSSTRPQE